MTKPDRIDVIVKVLSAMPADEIDEVLRSMRADYAVVVKQLLTRMGRGV